MKYVSLFAGIGGFDLALNRLGHECVYANEWDRYAAQIYEKNFGHKPDTRDITNVSNSDIPDHDFLCGGFPCQSFSVAGKRGGFADVRGTLFFEIARILKEKQPRLCLLENVKGLLSHDQGKTFAVIIATLDELGYDCQWQVLNSKNFGVPQNRERIFIIGNLRGKPRPKIFPIGKDDEAYSKQTYSQTANTLTANYWKGPAASRPFIDESPVVPTIRATQHKRGDNDTLIGTYRTHKDGNGFREIKEGISPTIPARAREDGSGQPVIAIPDGGMKIRRLTPLECERLQGFPDSWTEGISDTQRYKCLGNAVTVNVVEEIIKRLV